MTITMCKSDAAHKADSGWNRIYKLGGIAALIAFALFLLDIIISFGGGDVDPNTLTAVDWYAIYENNRLFGLRMLGFINVISLTVTIPLYLAIYALHKESYKVYATLTIILYLIGTAIYLSNNAAIPMSVLGSKYFAAATVSQRELLAAAGEAILAKGADFTPGSFIGFILTEAAGIFFSLIMLGGGIFSGKTAWAGILGFTLLTVFTVWVTFVSGYFQIAMITAMFGGIFSLAWHLLTARRLLQLSQ
jgi:hypothetical protein